MIFLKYLMCCGVVKFSHIMSSGLGACTNSNLVFFAALLLLFTLSLFECETFDLLLFVLFELELVVELEVEDESSISNNGIFEKLARSRFMDVDSKS